MRELHRAGACKKHARTLSEVLKPATATRRFRLDVSSRHGAVQGCQALLRTPGAALPSHSSPMSPCGPLPTPSRHRQLRDYIQAAIAAAEAPAAAGPTRRPQVTAACVAEALRRNMRARVDHTESASIAVCAHCRCRRPAAACLPQVHPLA